MGAPQQWFSKRRGLAVGITFAGSGVGGLVIANVSMAAIKSIGYRWALRIDGIIVFVLLSFSTCFVRPLGDVRRTGGGRKVINWYLFKNPMFSVMFMHGLITTFGYMVRLQRINKISRPTICLLDSILFVAFSCKCPSFGSLGWC